MTVPFRHRRINRDQDVAAPLATLEPAPSAGTKSHRGQVLVIFSGTFVILLLMSALVIDLAWLWNNSLRIQRTADAAALAGVVFLPNTPAAACDAADKEATRNGYPATNVFAGGVCVPATINGVTVTPVQDLQNPRRLNVRVTAPVKTFFLGLIGMNTITVSRQAHAEYVLPVPMGSPENYYGVFGDVRNATFTTTGTVNHPGEETQEFDGDTSNPWDSPANNTSGCSSATPWVSTGNAGSNDGNYTDSNSASGSCHYWRNYTFGFTTPVVSIDGVQVRLRALRQGSGGGSSDCRLEAALSWNNGTTWSAIRQTAALTTSEATYNLGGVADLWTPPAHTWTTTELNNATNFLVRLTWVDRPARPTAARPVRRASTRSRSTSSTRTQRSAPRPRPRPTPCAVPGPPAPTALRRARSGTPAGGGQVLNPRGFWGTMNTQGAENVDGDAFQPYYDTRTSGVALTCPTATPKACHGPDDFYNYAIEMQPLTTVGGSTSSTRSSARRRWAAAPATGTSATALPCRSAPSTSCTPTRTTRRSSAAMTPSSPAPAIPSSS